MIMRTHLHQTSSHLTPCLQVCPGLNQQIHRGGLTIPGSEMEGCATKLMKYKPKQTCRVRAAQRLAHINIWFNDHATHLHQTSSHLIPCLQVCPGLNQLIHRGGLTTPGSEMEGGVTTLMKYKHSQTCRVRAVQRPAHINIWCNDHACTSTSDVTQLILCL